MTSLLSKIQTTSCTQLASSWNVINGIVIDGGGVEARERDLTDTRTQASGT